MSSLTLSWFNYSSAIGVDIDVDALDIARENMSNLDIENVEFVQKDVRDLELQGIVF